MVAHSDSVPLSCYLEDPAAFRDFLSSNLSLSPGVVEGISGATVNTSEVNWFCSIKVMISCDNSAGHAISPAHSNTFR